MPALNKQTLINLLIDSPLREPIKINLIDIVNNTNDADLPKVYPTITKELEIFQKATDRRLKLADETLKKLSPTPPTPQPTADTPVTDAATLQVPPLDLPPLPQPTLKEDSTPIPSSEAQIPSTAPATAPSEGPALPPLPTIGPSESADEDALKEIQKELDALKESATIDANPPTPTPPQPEV